MQVIRAYLSKQYRTHKRRLLCVQLSAAQHGSAHTVPGFTTTPTAVPVTQLDSLSRNPLLLHYSPALPFTWLMPASNSPCVTTSNTTCLALLCHSA